jgi:hypothetical protein
MLFCHCLKIKFSFFALFSFLKLIKKINKAAYNLLKIENLKIKQTDL